MVRRDNRFRTTLFRGLLVLLVIAAGPASVKGQVDEQRLERIDELVEHAIAERQLPGAVVLIGRGDDTIYKKAFGDRALQPEVEPMEEDTIFDMASLTKVMATTTSVMRLLEEARLHLHDRVATYIPEFAKYGKEEITIRHLLTHTSGLRPDLDLAFEWRGSDEAIRLATEEVPVARPDERFIYSDINFFLLGDIVRRVSGQTLDRYAREHIFEPLGMDDTMFLPPPELRERIAPTQLCTPFGWPCRGPNQRMLRGVVHDPTSRRMDGVAGHAGLFTTAEDVERFARMLLNGGRRGDTRILSPLTVRMMTRLQTPPTEPNARGFGWDIDSTFSRNRGALLPLGSFGHTGFTGTSLWVDPATRLYVIFLSNRVHPTGEGNVNALRGDVATIAASALANVDDEALARADRMRAATVGRSPGRLLEPDPVEPSASPVRPVLTGIDVLRAERFKRLAGRRIGLVTNHTGLARDRASTIDLLHEAPNLTLVALFSPEHGIRGVLDEKVSSSRDEKTGLPVYSLYGDTRRPTSRMLEGIDTLIVDIQDIGARFYTYTTTMAYVMEEAAKRRIEVIVLDRPNPIGGWQIEGPVQDVEAMGFTGYFPMPIRHGLTFGELARLFNTENKIRAKLTVVEMEHWRRDAWFDETGQPWTNPSPNMRNMHQAALYTGIGAIEGTNISVGRGTDTPFEQVGAPWIDGNRLAEELNARALAGVRFYPVSFTPASSRYANERCGGVFIIVTDREALQPVRVGLEIASALARLYPAQYELERARRLFGSEDLIVRIRKGDEPADTAASWAEGEARWRLKRAPYLIYR
ncbi:MAG: exo-beta-N-acetylmuramidase NamZ domain-containing protein [Vicinamibacteraceae bacterium]